MHQASRANPYAGNVEKTVPFCFYTTYNHSKSISGNGSPSGVVADVLDYENVVCEFELQSHYYVQCSTNKDRGYLKRDAIHQFDNDLLLGHAQ